MNRSPNHLPALAAVVLGAALDLATKSWAFDAVDYGDTRPLLGDWLVLHPRLNPAGPWSLFHGVLPEWMLRALLPALSVVAVGVLLRILWKSDPSDRVKALGLALILAGAAGNLWDRTLFLIDPAYGGVRDFILLPRIVFGKPFPAFNLADTWITVGVVLVGWRMIFEDGQAGAEGPPPAGAGEVRA